MDQRADYPIVTYRESFTNGSDGWIALHPDLEGCVGYGHTRKEARESLDQARAAYLRLMERLGRTVPPPPESSSSETREILDPEDESEQSYSETDPLSTLGDWTTGTNPDNAKILNHGAEEPVST